MKIIKEVIENVGEPSHCIVRSDSYNKSLAHSMALAQAAKHDFPALTDGDIQVLVYLGPNHMKMRGVEFYTDKPVPDSYTRVQSSEHAV